jgi:hypothetical protein
MRWLSPGAAAVALFACAGVSTESEGEGDLAAYRTYAWAEDVPDAVDPEDGDLAARVRTAVDAALAGRGLQEVGAGGTADLGVTWSREVAERVQRNDPYYSTHVAEKYEEGTLSVELVDAQTKAVVWRGLGRSRLRYTARTSGLHSAHFADTGEPRQWPVDDMVHAIFARLPAR